MNTQRSKPAIGRAWLWLTIAFALHVADEAANDFLQVYNPAVRAIREQLPLLPLPTFSLSMWLTGLIIAILIMFALTKYAYRNTAWIRILAWIYGIIMLLNGIGHITVSLVYGFMMPGTWSSPLLIAASIWLLASLIKSKNAY